MAIVETYYKIALFFTNTPFLLLASLFVFFVIDRKIALNTLVFVIATIFINQYLKSIWQIPMHESLGKIGWAFPSGHTQINVVFWLCLFWQMKNKWLALFIAVLLPSSYFAMVDANFHTWGDIAGGIIAGVLVFVIFVLWHKYCTSYQMATALIIVLACFSIMWMLPVMPHGYLWLWFYMGNLIPIASVFAFEKEYVERSNRKFYSIILFCTSSLVVFAIEQYQTEERCLLFIKGFVIAFLVVFLVPLLGKQIEKAFKR